MLEVRRNPEWSDILCVAITERNRQPPHQPKWDAAFTISGPRVAPELDEEEFAARSSSNGHGKATHGYCSIVGGEWAASCPTRTTPACGDQSKSTAS
jgi:hypothetical protein